MTAPDEALAHELAERRRTIMEMPAGEELDAEVQAAVFGSTVYHGRNFRRIVLDEPHALEAELIPPYSTDLCATWLVVERITDPSASCNRPPAVVVPFWMPPGTRFGFWFDVACLWAYSASDVALEICRAAVLAAREASRP